jgi:hypothetical protein
MDRMLKLLATCLLAVTFLPCGIASAQVDTDRPGPEPVEPVRDYDMNWGWLGLIGLAGLFGLMGRDRSRTEYPATTTRTTANP